MKNKKKMSLKIIVVALLLSPCILAENKKSLNQMLSWKVLEYGFPNDNDRQYAIDNGLMTANTGTPIDVDINYSNSGKVRVFVTIPRFTEGIPFTLATVSNEVGPNGPIIYAYPSYEWHNKNNAKCEGITSAFRVAIDECHRMWVIDSGLIAGVQICPPQLLTFDLKTNKLVHSYEFSSDLFMPVTSLFVTPVLDVSDPPPRGRCQNVMAYVADVTGHGMVVYDAKRNTGWRVENILMDPSPQWANQTIAGESFILMDGIFGLNLTPRSKKGGENERYLYFHALASETENEVPLSILNNQTIWKENLNAEPDAFRVIGKRGVQISMDAIDSKGNVFATTHDLKLFVWNIKTPYEQSSFKVVGNDPEQLQFVSGLKVVRNPRGQEELWLSSCRFQKVAAGTQDPTEINYRILACKTDDLLSGRGCSKLAAQSLQSSHSIYSNLILA